MTYLQDSHSNIPIKAIFLEHYSFVSIFQGFMLLTPVFFFSNLTSEISGSGVPQVSKFS